MAALWGSSRCASNLVAGDTNGAGDVFVHDRQTGTTTRASVGSGGTQANGPDGSWFPALNADGRYVGFQSWANNLIAGDTNGMPDVFVRDQQTGTTTLGSAPMPGTTRNCARRRRSSSCSPS